MLLISPQIISAYALGLEEWTWDSREWSKACEPWLMWRGKLSRPTSWYRRWLKVGWIQHLSTLTFADSAGKSIEDWWISSLVDSRVSHSARQDQEKQSKMIDIFGPTSNKASESSDQGLFSSRTSTESQAASLLDTTRFSTMSSAIWKKWVTQQRQESIRRRKLEHPTPGEDGSSLVWPTATSRDWKDTPGMSKDRKDKGRGARDCDQLPRAVLKKWPTPDTSAEKFRLAGNSQQSNSLEAMGRRGQLGQAKDNMNGSLPERLSCLWVEALMGFPVGWTDCEHSAMPVSQK